MPPIKLHRCPFTFVHSDLDSCWRVQKALNEQGTKIRAGELFGDKKPTL